MTEEIRSQRTADEVTNAVPVTTGGARCGAEREDKTPMVSWAALLEEAVTKPGHIHEAYSRFWGYSTGNQILAYCQCLRRQIPPGPLATFPKWKELGRHVKKGAKALTLCMPITGRRTRATAEDESVQGEKFVFTYYVWRARWFVLSQTEGAEYQPPAIPEWNEQRALATLHIEREAFGDLDGNVQGYAKRGRKIAVSPIAVLPSKTLFHEAAHILLGHTGDTDLSDSEATPRDLREVEAEAVALLCCESLGLAGADFSRGYIQSWGRGQTINERSAQRIFHAADQILRAGRPAASASQEVSQA